MYFCTSGLFLCLGVHYLRITGTVKFLPAESLCKRMSRGQQQLRGDLKLFKTSMTRSDILMMDLIYRHTQD